MATSVIKTQSYYKDNPITLRNDASAKVFIVRNHCVRYGNVFQFSLLLDLTEAYSGNLTDAGAVPPPKTYDTTATSTTSIIDALSNTNGRVRITKDGTLVLNSNTQGQALYNATYVIDD